MRLPRTSDETAAEKGLEFPPRTRAGGNALEWLTDNLNPPVQIPWDSPIVHMCQAKQWVVGQTLLRYVLSSFDYRRKEKNCAYSWLTWRCSGVDTIPPYGVRPCNGTRKIHQSALSNPQTCHPRRSGTFSSLKYTPGLNKSVAG